MSINNNQEFLGIKKVGDAVAITLKEMRNHARPGMSTKELDIYGQKVLENFGAKSAPLLTYGFPGCSCISLNNEIAHGIPSDKKILKEGDLINIDVSAELDGFFADNGGSFILGKDINHHQNLVDASKRILQKAITNIKGGVRISKIGELIELEAKKSGYKVIKNLGGHGVGRSLHEQPHDILNYKGRFDARRFQKRWVVAIETFIATDSTIAVEQDDGWTLVGNKGGFIVQHEHTIMVTGSTPFIFTEMNEIWN